MHRRRVVGALAVGLVGTPWGCGGASPPAVADDDGSGSGSPSSTSQPAGETGADSTGDATTGTTTGNETDTEGPQGCRLPSGVNAMIDADDALYPLVQASAAEAGAVAFVREGAMVHARDPWGQTLWTADVGDGAITGGFDFDSDGWPDLAVAYHVEGLEPCGAQTIGSSWLTLLHGVDGTQAIQTAPENDICWVFPGTTYPTVQWTTGTVLFGAPTAPLVLSATYAASSSFMAWDGAAFANTPLAYPSSQVYDNAYRADVPNAWGTGTSFLANSHIANGMMVDVGGEARVVLFTSGRVVQYVHDNLTPTQLRTDLPYLTGDRTDIAGRNYGLVTRDPNEPDHVALLAGTSAYSMHADLVAGSMSFDPWGQIERHVSLYSLQGNTVQDRFYSYAHDADDGHQYEGRLAYPDSPWVVTAPGEPSRLAYSVYEQGHWMLHVSQPGSIDDALVLQGAVLWDIRDLDGDGIDEWVVSPSELPEDPDVPGYYFTRWRTDLWHWDEAAVATTPIAVFEQGIPALEGAFGRPTHRTSMGAMYPVPVVADERCVPALVLRSSDGARVHVDLP